MFRKRISIAATAALLILGSIAPMGGPARAAEPYLAEYEDLPLPTGLIEQPGGTLFESPTGRIVEATASGELSAGQVRDFYRQALPQLGWEPMDGGFKRDNEFLRIDIDGRPRSIVVRFSVVPQ